MNQKLVFIGAGNMASAIVGGLIGNGYPANLITMTDINESNLNKARSKWQVNTSKNNQKAIDQADVIIIAVKPQILPDVLSNLNNLADKAPLILSIAAGVSCSKIQSLTYDQARIIRAMPNTPALIEMGATGLYANEQVNEQDKDITEQIIQSIGILLWFDKEDQIDAVTAISGSGPAYFFLMMENMIQAGVELGLTEEQARTLSLQTAKGAASLAIASEEKPAQLREQVTSPGGTTEAAINEMKGLGIDQSVQGGVKAAFNRAKEL